MFLLSASPEDSRTWFAHHRSRRIPGGVIRGFPGAPEITLRITYSSSTVKPETARYREVAAWLRENSSNRRIRISSDGYSRTVRKTDLEDGLFETLVAAQKAAMSSCVPNVSTDGMWTIGSTRIKAGSG